jgi:drug/metabolite transporter (DMT)-like permease
MASLNEQREAAASGLPQARTPASSRVFWAIAIYAASFAIFPVSDALAKRLATRYPAAEIGAIRNAVHLVVVCGAAFFWYGARTLRTTQPGRQALRGALAAAATLCMFAALRTVSLANVVTLLFVSPLLVVALSGPMLGEKIRYSQWLAVGAGLVGVTLVARPTVGGFGAGVPLALAAAAFSALNQVMSRKLARTDKPLVGLFYVSLAGTVLLGGVSSFEWRAPRSEDFLLMIAMGLIAAVGYFGVFKAIELASPHRLAPFYYLQIVTAVALGYWFFDEIPDEWTLLGMAVIIGAGLVCLALERSHGRMGPPPHTAE